MTNCKNCGAVINPQENKCSYCGTSYLNEGAEWEKMKNSIESFRVSFIKSHKELFLNS